MKNVYAQLENRLEAIIPGKARIEFKTLVGANPDYLIRGQAGTEATPNGIKGIIDLATGTLRPDMTVEQAVNELVGTLNHEMIHVLKDQGVIRPEEWRMLSRSVAKTNIPGKKYTYLDKAEAVYTPNGKPISPTYNDPDAVVEEAVAEMYREWVLNGLKPPQQNVGIFNRITEFFRRIFQTLRNARHEDFFKQIESGEVGRREGEGPGPAFARAFAKSQLGGGTVLPATGAVFVSVKDADKPWIVEPVKLLLARGFRILATGGTATYLADQGLAVERVRKVLEGRPHIVDAMKNGGVQLVFNTTEGKQSLADSYEIRRTALMMKIPYFTTSAGALAAAQAITAMAHGPLDVRPLQDYAA
jgi:hypothetical protein